MEKMTTTRGYQSAAEKGKQLLPPSKNCNPSQQHKKKTKSKIAAQSEEYILNLMVGSSSRQQQAAGSSRGSISVAQHLDTEGEADE